MSETPGSVDHSGPPLGQHTEEILLEQTSNTTARLNELENQGVIKTGD
jgi:crotonobetainyl-CoA:carnitine CoA-transferase CaiB-like acyl-CoA transferase